MSILLEGRFGGGRKVNQRHLACFKLCCPPSLPPLSLQVAIGGPVLAWEGPPYCTPNSVASAPVYVLSNTAPAYVLSTSTPVCVLSIHTSIPVYVLSTSTPDYVPFTSNPAYVLSNGDPAYFLAPSLQISRSFGPILLTFPPSNASFKNSGVPLN